MQVRGYTGVGYTNVGTVRATENKFGFRGATDEARQSVGACERGSSLFLKQRRQTLLVVMAYSVLFRPDLCGRRDGGHPRCPQ